MTLYASERKLIGMVAYKPDCLLAIHAVARAMLENRLKPISNQRGNQLGEK